MKNKGAIQRFLLLMVSVIGFQSCQDNGRYETTGTVEGQSVVVSAQVGGVVTDLLSEEGQSVDEGDLLIQLDTLESHLQWVQAFAAFRQAKYAYELMVTGARAEDIIAAQQALEAASVRLEQAKKDQERLNSLTLSKSVSQKQLDDVNLAVDLATTNKEQARQAFNKLKSGSRYQDIGMAQAKMDQAKANADLIRKKISDAGILAPINGRLTSVAVEKGEWVRPGMQVVEISSMEHIDINVYIPESLLGLVKTGQSVEVWTDSFPDSAFTGKVTTISSQAEFTPKNIQTKEDRVKLVFKVRIKVYNPDEALKPGLPADVVFTFN